MRLLTFVIGGCLFAVFVLLPLDEFTSYYEYHFAAHYTVSQFVAQRLWNSLTFGNPDKLLLYLSFGACLGIAGYLLMAALLRRNTVIAQLESELGKDLSALIRHGEDDNLEFKSSFRYDYRQQKLNRALEGVIIKTLAGFMNANGGSLLIGVADDGSVVGLEKDFQTLSRKDSDGYTQLLMSTVAERLGTPACRLLRILFYRHESQEVCRIIVLPSPVPIYARENNQSHFYIRTASGTREMELQEAVGFIKAKWG